MRNEAGEEIGGQSYYNFAMRLLRSNRGVITGEQLEREVRAAFEHLWGPDDTRLLKRGRAKWQNAVDWAKSQGHKRSVFFTRSKRINGKKITYIVMPDLAVDTELVLWVLAKKVKNSFRKRCGKCGYKDNKLVWPKCAACLHPFPLPTKKVQAQVP